MKVMPSTFSRSPDQTDSSEAFSIVAYDDAVHRDEVVALWRAESGDTSAHNEPNLAINRKLAVQDGLFFVAIKAGEVVGSIMAGYDGHRGWLYSLVVRPDRRHQGIGSALVREAEQALAVRGCMKINLQIVEGNAGVKPFYEALGYALEIRYSMGKRL